MKEFINRFRPLNTPGKEAVEGMDADKERKKRIASYIDRMTAFVGDTPEQKYSDELEKFQKEQFPKLSPGGQVDMRIALLNISERWEAAYAKQGSPNPALERMHARTQELKRWIESVLGSTQ